MKQADMVLTIGLSVGALFLVIGLLMSIWVYSDGMPPEPASAPCVQEVM